MYFPELRGMGFNKGNITINCINETGESTTAMNAYWYNVVVNQDRATAKVWIALVEADAMTTGPHVNSSGQPNPIDIRIKNDVTLLWSAWYLDRIRVQSN